MFERLYDVLMSDVDYEQIFLQIEPYVKKEDLIVDAGCGSGYFLIELMKHGYDAIGIDLSSSMLALAQDHLREEGLYATLYEHDLRQPLPIKVDVIFAMFDVMNYFKGVKRVFNHIKQALLPKGKFIFDLYKEEVLEIYDGYEEIGSQPINYEWTIHRKKKMFIHDVVYDNHRDHIMQYVYPLHYYVDILEDIGFDVSIIPSIDSRKHLIIATLR